MADKLSRCGSAAAGAITPSALGLFLICWGGMHLSTPCSESPHLAAALIVLGTGFVLIAINAVLTAFDLAPDVVLKVVLIGTALTVVGALIWSLVAAFSGDLWVRMKAADAATATASICEPAFYKTASITLIVICALMLTVSVVVCICCLCLGTVLMGSLWADKAAKREASEKRMDKGARGDAGLPDEESPLTSGDAGSDVEHGRRGDVDHGRCIDFDHGRRIDFDHGRRIDFDHGRRTKKH